MVITLFGHLSAAKMEDFIVYQELPNHVTFWLRHP
jgi:hypothetical protein